MTRPRTDELMAGRQRLVARPAHLPPRQIGVVALTAFAVVVAVWLLVAGRFTFSSLLVEDDAIYVPRALFGDPIDDEWTVSITEPLLDVTTQLFGSVVAPKLLSVGMAGLFAAAVAVLLAVVSRRRALSVLAASVIVTYPITDEIGVFALGAHPYFAGAAVIVSAHLFLVRSGLGWPVLGPRVALASSAAFALAAMALSPVATLMPLAPLAWVLATAPGSGRGRSAVAVDAGIAAVPAVAAAGLGLFSYHYQSMPGWTDTSIGSGLDSLASAIAAVGAPVADATAGTRLLYAGALAVVACVAVVEGLRRRGSSADGRTDIARTGGDPAPGRLLVDAAVVLVVGGALTFGPGFAAANFQPRYAVLPFTFVVVAAAALLLRAVGRSGVPVLVGALALLLVLGGVRAGQVMSLAHAPALATHDQIAGLVAEEVAHWRPDAQVVLLLPDDEIVPTYGFNHWSTWSLRALTGRADITGLIGKEAWLSDDPFVDRYRDHGDEYWTVVEGRSRRIPMKGLVRARPLYTYALDPRGEWTPLDATVFVGVETTVVPFGAPPTSVAASGAQDSCEDSRGESLFWPTSTTVVPNPSIDDAGTAQRFGGSFDGTGSDTYSVQVPEGSTVHARMEFTARGPVPSGDYSAVEPPMPVLAQSFAIYERPEWYAIVDSVSGRDMHTAGRDDAVIEIAGIEGCFLVARTGGRTMTLADPSLSGAWSLGRGFMERFWIGEMQVTVSSSDAAGTDSPSS